MGATVSEKSFGTNMAVAPPRTLFGLVQQQQGHGFMNQYMQQQAPPHYNINSNDNFNGGMNGVDMFSAMLDQSKALSKMIEQNGQSSSGGGGGGGGSSSVINIGGGSNGSDDVTTLDLLGIGGGGGHGNFYGGSQQGGGESGSAAATADEVWRNWSAKNAGTFESFSATSNI